ncbi:MAG: hypothetical protein M1445_08420 [Bacteroidetes bacterium]|nr:hypothetical protein [Bacteroidota bacterium]MCL6101842.1 hypothetical protein [Bacteroidota bacterium]
MFRCCREWQSSGEEKKKEGNERGRRGEWASATPVLDALRLQMLEPEKEEGNERGRISRLKADYVTAQGNAL